MTKPQFTVTSYGYWSESVEICVTTDGVTIFFLMFFKNNFPLPLIIVRLPRLHSKWFMMVSGVAVLTLFFFFLDAVFRWTTARIAVWRWSQTLRYTMFVISNRRCPVKLTISRVAVYSLTLLETRFWQHVLIDHRPFSFILYLTSGPIPHTLSANQRPARDKNEWNSSR